MERRGFLKLFGMGVAGIALTEAIPLGRVWSFPKTLLIPRQPTFLLTTEWISQESLRLLRESINDQMFEYRFFETFGPGWSKREHLRVGDVLTIRSVNRLNT